MPAVYVRQILPKLDHLFSDKSVPNSLSSESMDSPKHYQTSALDYDSSDDSFDESPYVDILVVLDPVVTDRKEKKVHWIFITSLLISCSVSLNIFSIASTFKELGYVPACLLLVFFGSVSCYFSFLNFYLKLEGMKTKSLADITAVVFNKETGNAVNIAQSCLLFMFLSLAVLYTGICFQGMFKPSYCIVIFNFIAALTGTLSSIPKQSWVFAVSSVFGLASLILAVVFALIGLLSTSMIRSIDTSGLFPKWTTVPANVVPEVFATSSSWIAIISSVLGLIFCFGGNIVVHDLILEMQDTADFPKANMVSSTLSILMYTVVGSLSYTQTSIYSVSPFINNIVSVPFRSLTWFFYHFSTISCGSFYAHLLSRDIFSALRSAQYACCNTRLSRWCTWIFLVLTLWILAWLTLEIVPLFDQVHQLLTSILLIFVLFIVPASLWLHSRRQGRGSTKKRVALIVFITVFAGLSVAGFVGAVASIVESVAKLGIVKPFACHVPEFTHSLRLRVV